MDSIIYELRANDVKEEDIDLIINKIKNRLSEENLDLELVKLGYNKIFTIDYDNYDNYDSYDDYEVANDEYFNSKQKYHELDE